MDETARKKYQKDVEYFSGKLKTNPSSKVFMPLSLAYLKLGQYDKVIEVCSLGLDMHPEYIAAKTILAQAYLGKGMVQEAKPLLTEVAEFSKDNYRAYKLLGDIYRAEDNTKDALYYYRTALANSPEDMELRDLVNELAERIDAEPYNKFAERESGEVDETETEETVAGSETEGKTAADVDKKAYIPESADEMDFDAEEFTPEDIGKEQKEEIAADNVFFSNDDISEILEDSEEGSGSSESGAVESTKDIIGADEEKAHEDVNEWDDIGDISEDLGGFFEDTEKQVERLEKWLENVRKVKEKRNV